MTIVATAIYGGGEKVTLSGTSGSPNLANCTRAQSFGSATAAWSFQTDGTVDYTLNCTTTQWQNNVEWIDSQPSPQGDYWIRATVDAGSTPGGSAVGSWLKLTGSGAANRSWDWTKTLPGAGTVSGTLRIEIATDAAGSNIVATGYYRGVATLT